MQKHHIVFRSQGGLDIDINIIELTPEQHTGSNGPHMNRKIDLAFKTNLQSQLFLLFSKEKYTIQEIAQKLNKNKNYIEKHFLKVKNHVGIYQKEDIIRHLMGGKLYQI